MLISIERLIDGLVQTLTEAVLPDVRTPFARGQVYAAIDVLRNMRDRIEEKVAFLEAETASAQAALDQAAASLRAGGAAAAASVAAQIEAVRATAPPVPPSARRASLRQALIEAMTALDALPSEIAAAARSAIASHLSAQVMRDVADLKPSLLSEISRG